MAHAAANGLRPEEELSFDAVCVCSGLHEVNERRLPLSNLGKAKVDKGKVVVQPYLIPLPTLTSSLASALSQVPYLPSIDGMESFGGTVLHSADYKDRSVFRGKR